jgi:hypothetical protein
MGVSEAEREEMSKLAAMNIAFVWGISAVAFGLLPVWMSLLLPKINREISFSEIDLLKSGGIIIFAITLTISVHVDYYLSRFRFRDPSIAVWFNVFFPFAICLFGLIIHMITISTKSEVLDVSFVLFLDISIMIFAVIFCIIQKVLQVYGEERGMTP